MRLSYSAASFILATMLSTGAMALPADSSEETGLAAVYSNRLSGHMTASGKKYDPKQLTAAHKTLPFGTRVEVTNLKNGRTVELRITDRGPRQADRVLDISPRAAHALGFRSNAMADVKVRVLGTSK